MIIDPVTPEQVVRAIYEAWLEGRSARDLIADDVEYVNPPDAVEPGTKRGRRYFRGIRDVYDELSVTPERVEALDGGDVLVIARLTGRASGSGVGSTPSRATSGPSATGSRCASGGFAVPPRRSRRPGSRPSA